MEGQHGAAYTAPNLSYTHDRRGALETATDNTASQTLVSATSYGPANELLSITGASEGWYGETRTYNSIKQLTSLSSSGVNIAYNYPSSNNNGKIASQTDSVSGETVTYTYDSLNRLATAQNQTGFSPLWGQSFSYDGFSNLTGTSVTQGSAPTLSATYDVNNHAGGEDANGNPGSIYLPADGSSYAATYDVENRLRSTGSSTIFYSYAPGNRRVWQGTGSWTATYGTCNPTPGSAEVITFWGVNGQKLMTYNLTEGFVGSQCHFTATAIGTNYYFGNRLIKNTGGYVYPDRLGSIGKFYPYGIERPSATTNGTEKFTGYLRDAESGNDYAINRYMSPGMGRFVTPDPSQGSFANPADPGSWNLYAYTKGDPVNRVDRGGTDPSEADDSSDCVGDSPICFLMFSGEEDTTSFGAFCLSIAGSFGGNGDLSDDCNQVIGDCNAGQYSGVLSPGEEAADCQTADLAGLATPPPPPPTVETISFGRAAGDSGTLTMPSDGGLDTLQFLPGAAAGAAGAVICVADPFCDATVLIAGAGITIYVAATELPGLIGSIQAALKTGRKANGTRVDIAKEQLATARAELKSLVSSPTGPRSPKDKEDIARLKRLIRYLVDRIRNSEEHARIGQGSR